MSNGSYTNNGFVNDNGKSEKPSYNKPKEFSIRMSEKAKIAELDNYEPYEHRKVEHPLTNNETIIHLLKSALGTGIFAMPNAFNHAGYVVGFFATIILGSIATYCIHMLVNTHYLVCRQKKVPSMTYPQTAEAALEAGPERFRRFAPYMIHVVNTFLLIYQIGSCCIYVVFIAENLKALVDYISDTDIDKRLFMLIILLPLILINWIRNLKYLAPLSTLGNAATVVPFGIILYYIFREPLTLQGKEPSGSGGDFASFFGTVMFAMEAIGVIMPLENEMKTPKSFVGPTGILNRAMVLVVAMYVGLGLCGYLKYGKDIKPSITINLPHNELVAQLAKGMIACGVFITHAVALYVAIDIAWNQYILVRIENHPRKILWEYILRTVLVFVTFLLAVAIPQLDLFISLIGALALSMLGLAILAFIECCARWYMTSGMSRTLLVCKTIVICLIGAAGLIIGPSLSVIDIINANIK